jgi:hypothetical protein
VSGAARACERKGRHPQLSAHSKAQMTVSRYSMCSETLSTLMDMPCGVRHGKAGRVTSRCRRTKRRARPGDSTRRRPLGIGGALPAMRSSLLNGTSSMKYAWVRSERSGGALGSPAVHLRCRLWSRDRCDPRFAMARVRTWHLSLGADALAFSEDSGGWHGAGFSYIETVVLHGGPDAGNELPRGEPRAARHVLWPQGPRA